MASPISRSSSISSVSSIDRPTVNAGGFQHTSAATGFSQSAEQPRTDQRAAINPTNGTVAAEPLLSQTVNDQRGEHITDYGKRDPVQPHRTKYGTMSWYHDWWFWEIAGALLSLASTVAIVVMLAVCNHRPLPVLRYGITLNAMLSVLSTIAKVSATAPVMSTARMHLQKEYTDICRLLCFSQQQNLSVKRSGSSSGRKVEILWISTRSMKRVEGPGELSNYSIASGTGGRSWPRREP